MKFDIGDKFIYTGMFKDVEYICVEDNHQLGTPSYYKLINLDTKKFIVTRKSNITDLIKTGAVFKLVSKNNNVETLKVLYGGKNESI